MKYANYYFIITFKDIFGVVYIFTIRLKELRKAKKMTQDELAKRTGLSQTYISFLEKEGFSRDKSPTLQTIEILAKGLGVCGMSLLEYNCELCSIKTNPIDRIACKQNLLAEKIEETNKEMDEFKKE